jgi:hypothetical protein
MKIQGIITQNDLETWYELCQTKYRQRMGRKLLDNLHTEFKQEFPTLGELEPFLQERDYQFSQLQGTWQLPT